MLPAQFRLRPAKHAADQLRVVARLLAIGGSRRSSTRAMPAERAS